MNPLKIAWFIASIALLTSCDPGHHGYSYVRNNSSYPLEVTYSAHGNDTVILVAPNTTNQIDEFGGLGSGKDYNCCPCEYVEISIQPTDTSKQVNKTITDDANWEMNNPNIGKGRFKSKNIRCEFVVSESNIE